MGALLLAFLLGVSRRRLRALLMWLPCSAAADALNVSFLTEVVTHDVLEPTIFSVVVPSTAIACPP